MSYKIWSRLKVYVGADEVFQVTLPNASTCTHVEDVLRIRANRVAEEIFWLLAIEDKEP